MTLNFNLFNNYLRPINLLELHSTTDGFFSFTGTPFRETLALKLLAGHLQEFKPNLSKNKQETGAFGIKTELYRPFQSILGSLTLFCGLPTCSTFGMIQQLLQKGLLCSEGAKNLTQALSQLLSLRFEAHTFYQSEGEYLLHIEQGQPQDPQYLYLDENRLASLHEIYKVLIPFHSCAEQFLHAKNPQSFSKSVFYDKSPQIQGAAFEQDLQYGKAQEARQQAVSLNPNDVNTHIMLGIIEGKMAQHKEALQRHLKALVLAQQKYGENHLDVATCYNNIGQVYDSIGEYDQALDYYQKALKIQPLHQEPLFLATGFSNIGLTYTHLGKKELALAYYQKALLIYHKIHGEKHLAVATCYNNIALVYSNHDDDEMALPSYLKALQIQLHILGENDPTVAINRSSIGVVYNNLGDYAKALEFQQKALEALIKVLGKDHPDIGVSYNNISQVYRNMEQHKKALIYQEMALAIFIKSFGQIHPDIALSYTYIGTTYSDLGMHDQALRFYQKALPVQLQLFGHNHSNVMASYRAIGHAYYILQDNNRALEYFQKALEVMLEIFDENHSDVAAIYNNIGAVYFHNGAFDMALDYQQKVLKILIPKHGKNYSSIQSQWQTLFEFTLQATPTAIRNLEALCTLSRKILGEQDPLVRLLTRIILKTRIS